MYSSCHSAAIDRRHSVTFLCCVFPLLYLSCECSMPYSSPFKLPLCDSEHLRTMTRIATVPHLPRPACCLPSVMSVSVILLHATPSSSVSSVHLSPGSHLGFLVSISRAFLSHVLSSQPCVLHLLQHGRITCIVSPCVCVCRCSV